jgi:hypothetical protein
VTQALLVTIGLSFGLLPEGCAVLLACIGAWSLLKGQAPMQVGILEWGLIGLCIVRVIFYWRLSMHPWNGVFEVGALWLIGLGWQFLRQIHLLKVNKTTLKLFSLGLALGIVVSFFISASTITIAQQPIWQPFNAKQTIQINGHNRFVPKNENADYVVRTFGNFASGEFDLNFEARAEQSISINLTLLQFGTDVRFDKQCILTKMWKTCRMSGVFTQSGLLAGAFGSFLKAEWKRGSTPIEVRDLSIRRTSGQNFDPQMLLSARSKGLTFNENALGGWMAVLIIIALYIPLSNKQRVVTILPAFLTILFSGSRNALFAAFSGIIFMLLRLRLIYVMIVLISIGMVWISFDVLSIQVPAKILNPRIFNLADSSSTQERFRIFKLAFNTWLESPVFGVGDLRTKMQDQINVQVKDGSFVGETVTHAHNLWLQTAGESGLIGVMGMLALWGVVLQKAYRRRDVGGLAVLMAIFVLNSVDYLFYYAPIQVAFWLAASGGLNFPTDKRID